KYLPFSKKCQHCLSLCYFTPGPHQSKNWLTEMEQVFFIDHPSRFAGQRYVETQNICLTYNFLHRYFSSIFVRKSRFIFVICYNFNIDSRKFLCHSLSIMAIPNQGDGTPHEFVASVLFTQP